jgi:hypothetical protein
VRAAQRRDQYDVLSTIALELTDSTGQPMRADTHLGERLGGHADTRKVTAASLIDEAVMWGIRRRAAPAIGTETLSSERTVCFSPGKRSVHEWGASECRYSAYGTVNGAVAEYRHRPRMRPGKLHADRQ